MLSFLVLCVQNYYSLDCSRFCERDIDWTCDPGFTGELCHVIDDCLGVDCDGNGRCIDDINFLSVSVILATLQWNTVHVHDVNIDDCTEC